MRGRPSRSMLGHDCSSFPVPANKKSDASQTGQSTTSGRSRQKTLFYHFKHFASLYLFTGAAFAAIRKAAGAFPLSSPRVARRPRRDNYIARRQAKSSLTQMRVLRRPMWFAFDETSPLACFAGIRQRPLCLPHAGCEDDRHRSDESRQRFCSHRSPVGAAPSRTDGSKFVYQPRFYIDNQIATGATLALDSLAVSAEQQGGSSLSPEYLGPECRWANWVA